MGLGILTLSELKDETKRALGNRSDCDDRLTRFLNLAQQRIARIREFQELQQTAADNFTITSNIVADKFLDFTDLREIHSFRVINDSESVKLRQVSTRQWDRNIPQPEFFARGVPSHYTIWERRAEMWKVPDRAYQYIVRWTKWPAAFSDGSLSATSDFLSKDELLIKLAVAYAFDSLGKLDEADREYKLVGALMLEAVNTESSEPDLEFAPSRTIFDQSITTREYWNDPFNLSGAPNG